MPRRQRGSAGGRDQLISAVISAEDLLRLLPRSPDTAEYEFTCGKSESFGLVMLDWAQSVVEQNMRGMVERAWGWDARKLRGQLSARNTWFLTVWAKGSGSPAGFVAFRFDHEELEEPMEWNAWVYEIHVVDEHRGKGLGSQMLGILESVCSAAACPLIRLVVLDENRDARRFYVDRLGFVVDPDSPDKKEHDVKFANLQMGSSALRKMLREYEDVLRESERLEGEERRAREDEEGARFVHDQLCCDFPEVGVASDGAMRALARRLSVDRSLRVTSKLVHNVVTLQLAPLCSALIRLSRLLLSSRSCDLARSTMSSFLPPSKAEAVAPCCCSSVRRDQEEPLEDSFEPFESEQGGEGVPLFVVPEADQEIAALEKMSCLLCSVSVFDALPKGDGDRDWVEDVLAIVERLAAEQSETSCCWASGEPGFVGKVLPPLVSLLAQRIEEMPKDAPDIFDRIMRDLHADCGELERRFAPLSLSVLRSASRSVPAAVSKYLPLVSRILADCSCSQSELTECADILVELCAVPDGLEALLTSGVFTESLRAASKSSALADILSRAILRVCSFSEECVEQAKSVSLFSNPGPTPEQSRCHFLWRIELCCQAKESVEAPELASQLSSTLSSETGIGVLEAVVAILSSARTHWKSFHLAEPLKVVLRSVRKENMTKKKNLDQEDEPGEETEQTKMASRLSRLHGAINGLLHDDSKRD